MKARCTCGKCPRSTLDQVPDGYILFCGKGKLDFMREDYPDLHKALGKENKKTFRLPIFPKPKGF
ncbi:hypothetical protein HO291_003401 [Salmonella enterica]|nr:hypothetical protein [Salmonella enterica]